MDITPGLVGEVEVEVTPEMTASAVGNEGVQVLSTPHLIGLMENASIRAIHPHLPAGAGTVGILVNIRHLAATPVGMRVRARAVLREVDRRRFVFDVEAHDDHEKVGEGIHERFQIQTERFLARAMEKTRPKV
jgi:predicted thioesterase